MKEGQCVSLFVFNRVDICSVDESQPIPDLVNYPMVIARDQPGPGRQFDAGRRRGSPSIDWENEHLIVTIFDILLRVNKESLVACRHLPDDQPRFERKLVDDCSFARTRLVKLKQQCSDRPTETGRRVLQRIAKNKLPYGLKRWPDDVGT